MPPQALEEIDLAKAENLFRTNVFGTIHGMRTAIRVMKSQKGIVTHGTIVNIIYTTAFDGMNGSSGSMYVASKYALRGLTNVVWEELKKDVTRSGRHIEVIGVYPGGFKTDLFGGSVPANFNQFMSVEEVAGKIVENLEKAEPETQLVIKRPGQASSDEIQ